MEQFDIVIAGAGFSGLTLGHHLPKHLRVLIIDAKPSAGFTVESTGLITVKTREEFASFFPIDRFITNSITSICVIAPGFNDYFISKTDHAWIFQTDTKELVRHLAETLPSNVTLRSGTTLTKIFATDEISNLEVLRNGKPEQIATRFLVGADGGRSKTAELTPGLDLNKRFLIGYEQVFAGDVHLGPHPAETIYHFWFGEFSLGYGGWLSPTVMNGKRAFRIGLAKLQKNHKELQGLMKKFIETLLHRGIITITDEKPYYSFGNTIPIGGALRKIHHGNVLLIGDAAGLCGAFAADGIKGSVVSGKEASPLISEFLQGKRDAFSALPSKMNHHGGLMEYYKRQVRYRFIWDQMQRNRTFRAMYNIIAAESASFLDQFCDSKDKRKSLSSVVLKFKHFPLLIKYTFFILIDMAGRIRRFIIRAQH